jgi:hypothetical protein
MSCDDIDEALDMGAVAGSANPDVEEHLNHCARCRKPVTALSLPVSEAFLSPPNLLRLKADLYRTCILCAEPGKSTFLLPWRSYSLDVLRSGSTGSGRLHSR